ncbi:hypothetical protein NDU88_001648 [Pleurodeles waltl]|uniref:Uncharacterized protein n=1 Tax=Pleurodeles waltl TaxID=8319 RepID=A0AAV7UTD7_PLEWA|nr:hypothetical protein NDU88_001648 [Pleurodeles waltl]
MKKCNCVESHQNTPDECLPKTAGVTFCIRLTKGWSPAEGHLVSFRVGPLLVANLCGDEIGFPQQGSQLLIFRRNLETNDNFQLRSSHDGASRRSRAQCQRREAQERRQAGTTEPISCDPGNS